MGFSYNTWGGSWGSAWGNSWGAGQQPAPVGASKPSKKERYPLRIIHGDKLYYAHNAQEERALIESLLAKPKQVRKKKPLKVYVESQPELPPLVFATLAPDMGLFTEILAQREAAQAKMAAELADEEAMLMMLGMVL